MPTLDKDSNKTTTKHTTTCAFLATLRMHGSRQQPRKKIFMPLTIHFKSLSNNTEDCSAVDAVLMAVQVAPVKQRGEKNVLVM